MVIQENMMMKLNICLLIEGDELLKKYNNIWNKVSNNVNKESDSNPA